jgi:hypothetical protein
MNPAANTVVPDTAIDSTLASVTQIAVALSAGGPTGALEVEAFEPTQPDTTSDKKTRAAHCAVGRPVITMPLVETQSQRRVSLRHDEIVAAGR